MDYIFFIFLIPIAIIVLVIIIVFILLSQNKSNSSKSQNSLVHDDNSYNNVNRQSPTEQLLELKKLYDAGILTNEEFNEQKNKILKSY